MAERKNKGSRQLWSARFSEPVDELMMRFGASIGFDRRLAAHDLRASAAHARMLGKTGIISRRDANAILRGLKQIGEQIEAGRFRWKIADEDVHTAIERRLIELIGDAGGRLHTARSRNDQVATDIRLWLKEDGAILRRELALLRRALISQARRHVKTIMPGMTHLQVAQPTTFGHHLHAHERAFARDSGRLADAIKRADVLPLGSAALAGTAFAIDRKMVARELGFAAVSENTTDAVASRDFAIEFAGACLNLMVNLSRLCEEIVIWSSQGFGLVTVADAYCTGSSIMPQKRNPDAAELIRGKSGRVAGHLAALAMMSKGQPLAYNKDNQEDKEALFDCL
ncbi:MAG: argininosuccinate lyase, partial [Betaproteobacteria bacterium]|nr:argininosuccinate lyase [Betaproteobacteria bacterium]